MADEMATSPTTTTVESDIAFHPGGLLAEELEARSMTQASLAEAIGRPPRLVSAVIRGRRPITAAIALELERALGIPALFWLRQQIRYDLYLARQTRAQVTRGA